MKPYIGAKILLAEPQEKDGRPGYRVRYPDGYESWSPADTFETAYRRVTNGEASLIVSDSRR